MWPSKLKGDPNKRSKDKYCHFHRDHSHDTSECYNLKQQIEAFIRQEKLQQFISKERTDPPHEQAGRRDGQRPRPPLGDTRMIVEDTTTSSSSRKACKTYLGMVQNVQLTGFIPKLARVDNPIVGFSEEDALCLHHLHGDALVVSIRMGDYNTHWVVVDNGSFVDILYYLTFQQMRIEKEWLISTNAPLIGFGGMKVYPIGAITLPMIFGDYSQQITKDVTFLIVDCLSAYNAILGQPTLNLWKAMTSTYHLMIKFLTEYDVGEVRGH